MLSLCSKCKWLPTRDGNGSDLDRVQVDPDPDPCSRTGSRSGPRSADPILQDPDLDPRILRIQYRIRVQNGSNFDFFLFLNVLRLQTPTKMKMELTQGYGDTSIPQSAPMYLHLDQILSSAPNTKQTPSKHSVTYGLFS